MPSERYDGIQCLRGAAAFLVLSAHVYYLTAPASAPMSFLFEGGGAAGVDIFFVISGFVIALTTDGARRSPARFLKDRLARVMPLYIIASLPFILVLPVTAKSAWNTLFLAPIFDFGAYSNPAHEFGWTIAFEIWFYAAFAFALAVHPRRAAVIFAAAILAIMIAAAHYHGEWIGARFFGMPLSAEFLAGVAIYKCRRRLGPDFAVPSLIVGALLLLSAMIALPVVGQKEDAFGPPGVMFIRLFAWGVPAALIVAGAVAGERAGLFPKVAPLIWFGDISYSFYLAQPLAIAMLAPIGFRHWASAWAALFATTLIIAAFSSRFIEKPVAAALKSAPNARARPRRTAKA